MRVRDLRLREAGEVRDPGVGVDVAGAVDGACEADLCAREILRVLAAPRVTFEPMQGWEEPRQARLLNRDPVAVRKQLEGKSNALA